MLSIVDIDISFNGFEALRKVCLEALAGKITGLVGPNGSGKSTLLNVISGILVPDKGQLTLLGSPVPVGRPDLVSRLGIGRTFQIPRLANRLTVLQNMLVSVRNNPGENINLFFRPQGIKDAERQYEKRAWDILGRLGLQHQFNEYAGLLSGGQQKLLSMGMLLMADPKVILLDEPAAGVNPVLIEQQILFLRNLRNEGRTILLIEHNMEVISSVCDKVYVLDEGVVIAAGTPKEIQNDPIVVRSYLGGLI